MRSSLRILQQIAPLKRAESLKAYYESFEGKQDTPDNREKMSQAIREIMVLAEHHKEVQEWVEDQMRPHTIYANENQQKNK